MISGEAALDLEHPSPLPRPLARVYGEPVTAFPEDLYIPPEALEVFLETFEGPLDLANYKDEYREGLQKIIDAKIAGEEIVAPSVEAPPRVVNLMEALKKSLNTVSAQKKRPAKASLAKPAAKRKRA